MVQPRLLAILSEQLYYDEIAIPFTRMQNECKQLISLLADSNIDLQDRLNSSVFTIDQANELVSLHDLQGCSSISLAGQHVESQFPFLSFPGFLFVWITCKLVADLRSAFRAPLHT